MQVITFFAVLAIANAGIVAPAFYSANYFGAYPAIAGVHGVPAAYVASPVTAYGYPLFARGSGFEGQYIPDITEKLYDDGSYRGDITEKLFDDGSYRGE